MKYVATGNESTELNSPIYIPFESVTVGLERKVGYVTTNSKDFATFKLMSLGAMLCCPGKLSFQKIRQDRDSPRYGH